MGLIEHLVHFSCPFHAFAHKEPDFLRIRLVFVGIDF